MICVQISGGIGNQMFQYAFGKSCCIIADDSELFWDDSMYYFDDIRSFSLDVFKIKGQKITLKQMDKISKEPVLFKWFKSIFKMDQEYFKQKIIIEKSFCYDVNFPEYRKKNVIFKGYWQSERYFNTIRSELLSDFQLSRSLTEVAVNYREKMIEVNSVSIHIRRGDYVKNEKTNLFHGVCPPSYYKKAVTFFLEKIPEVHFFIFSDDKDWVKSEFTFISNFSIVENVPFDYEELHLMSQCKHNIIANSSFSWWAAWLNTNPSKTIIAPKQWFANEEMQAQTQDLIPDNWIRI